MMKTKRYDLQYLRCFAISAVLGFHLKPELFPLGFLGVDVFFVLSGYLMTSLLNFDNGFTKQKIFNFYIRRLKRLCPVYFLTIFLTLFFAVYHMSNLDFENLQNDSFFAILFLTNLKTILKSESYFKMISDYSFLLHTWSLSVEFQFYFLAPFLLFLIFFTKKPLILTFLLIFWSWIFQFLMAFFDFREVAFCFLVSRIWQFLIGTAAFYAEKEKAADSESLSLLTHSNLKNDQKSKKLFLKQHIFGNFTVILLLIILFLQKSLDNFFWLTVFQLLVTFLTGAVIFFQFEINFLTVSKFFVYFGDISYSVYLIHWPIIVFAKYYFIFNDYSVVCWLILILFISILQYELFEKRLLFASKTVVFVVCLVLSCLTIYFIFNKNFEFLEVPKSELVIAHEKLFKSCSKFYDNFECNWDPELVENLNRTRNEIAVLGKYCSHMGNGNGTIMVAGNSFSMWHWSTVEKALDGKFKKSYLFSRSVCLLFEKFNHYDKRFDCKGSRNDFIKILEAIKPDLLIIDQKLSLNHYLRLPITESDNATQIITEYFKSFSQFTKKILIIEPNFSIANKNQIPAFSFVKNFPRSSSILKTKISIKEIEDEMDMNWKRIEKAIENCPKCELLPTRKQFCDENGCPFYDEKTNMSLFCDHAHLSVHGNLKLLSVLQNYFLQNSL